MHFDDGAMVTFNACHAHGTFKFIRWGDDDDESMRATLIVNNVCVFGSIITPDDIYAIGTLPRWVGR
jgi:hypothetical protein